MKYSICAAAVVVASILGVGIASPVQARRDKHLIFGQRKTDGRAAPAPTKEQREAMKYFHEPGYVLFRCDSDTSDSHLSLSTCLALEQYVRLSGHGFVEQR